MIDLINLSTKDISCLGKDFENYSKDLCNEVHCHKKLHEIFHIMWESELAPMLGGRGGFVDLVFRLVFFHQSIKGLDKYDHITTLTY